jgi:hypothetical protein
MIEGTEDAPTFGTWSIPGIGVIDLYATELPSNDWKIFEAVAERVLDDLVESEFEVLVAMASIAAASANAGAASSDAFVSGTIVA